MNFTAAWNADYIDAQYERWKSDPQSLSREWQFFFEGFELAASGLKPPAEAVGEDRLRMQARVQALIYRYRDLGHLMACLDPLAKPIAIPSVSNSCICRIRASAGG